MSLKLPKVSVIMGAYNEEKFLNEAVDSILNQTFGDFEFIIVNDGSTDRTQAILDSYHDPRMMIIINDENLGRSEARNKAISMAKGEYIAIMDADDISLPERLEREVKFLDNHDNIAAVGTYFFNINEKGGIAGITKFLTENDDMEKGLMRGNIIENSTVMLRKSCFDYVGGYREEFEGAEDYDLFLRLSEHFKLANLKEPLFKRRINPASFSVARKSDLDLYTKLAQELAKERREFGKDRLQIFKEAGNEKGLKELLPKAKPPSRKEVAQSYLYWGRVLLRGRDFKGATKLLLQSFLYNPFGPWILVLEDLVLLAFPKSITTILGRARRYLISKNYTIRN